MTHLAPQIPADSGASQFYEVNCTVESNDAINDEYYLLKLNAPPEILDCKPGQFFHLLCPTKGTKKPYLRRPMSIYGYFPDRGELHFLYKIVGDGTEAMAQMEAGEEFNVLGPLGTGYSIRDDWQNLLVVARGVGLATLAPLAQEAMRKGCNLTAICSARSPDVLMSVDHFRALGANVIAVTDSEGTSTVDQLKQLIEAQIARPGVDAFYTCGSNRLLKLLQRLGAKHKIPGEIALEQQMACGIGMCQCCVRSFRRNGKIVFERVCKEGPVFDLQEAMEW
ncbi:MAG: dihydroorotate dehydrogenase electron transfer subunit [Fimbriimonadaceae bacterium]|nr:dihydroorotate dehydrogenase electron transfer subunit [Alphaproteobacteria bacterium]